MHKKKLAFLFPGQGAQFPKMGYDVYQEFAAAREIFEEASDLLGISMKQLVFESSHDDLKLTKNCQISIFTVSCSIFYTLHSLYPEVVPYVCAGLSLGEYGALYASGKLGFSELITVVHARAKFMDEASKKYPGGLFVVLGLDAEKIESELRKLAEKVSIANLNCPGQVVISGSHQGLKKAEEALMHAGAKKMIPLEVSGAFHSSLMSEAREKLAPMIESMSWKDSPIHLVMNVTGGFVENIHSMKNYLIHQVDQPTFWEKSIKTIEQHDIDAFLEIGPGRTLAGMHRKIGVKAPLFSVETALSIKEFEKILSHSM